jgi:hypothetical protein
VIILRENQRKIETTPTGKPQQHKQNMKKQIALFSLVAAAFIAAPAVVLAQDTPAPAKKHEKHGGTPFHGKVSTVDTAGSTFTVGQLTINVTPETKITKDGKPASLSDITVGEKVGGSYKKDEAGKLNAVTVHAGEKGEKKKSEASVKN